MYKVPFIASLFAILVNHASCEKAPGTALDAITIILPKEEKPVRWSLRCTLEIAVNSSSEEDFNYPVDIQKFQKSQNGMEYIPNYYIRKNGNITDSCTFRIYPKMLNTVKMPDQIAANNKDHRYDNKHWRIITTFRLIEPNFLFREGVLLKRTFVFFMKEWSWWEQEHVNAVQLGERFASDCASTEYLYIHENSF